jgi:hypothetical protein
VTNQIFLAYDGDNAGRLVGRAILANDPGALSEVSSRIGLGHEVVKKWVEEHNGQVISGGGDEGLFSLPAEAVQDIEELRRDYEFATNLTMSVGVGQDLPQAGKSLMVAKFRGKNQVVMYDDSVDKDIQATQDRLSQGQGSEEEQKLGEAYLKPEDDKGFKQDSWQKDQIQKEKTGETPSETASDETSAKASAKTPAGTSAEKSSQVAQDSALTQESPEQATAKVNQEASAKVAQQEPKSDTRPDVALAEDRPLPDKNKGEQGQPNALPDKKKEKQKEEEDGQANKHASGKEMSTPREKAEDTGKDPSKNEFKTPIKKAEGDMDTKEKPKKEVKDEKGKEAPKEAPENGQAPPQEAHAQNCPTCGKPQEEAEEVIQENVDTPPADPQVQQEQMNNIDSGAMPVGSEMEGNVSRPDGFKEQNVPGDTGMPGGPEGGVNLEGPNAGDTQDDMMGQASPTDQASDQQIPGQEQEELPPGQEEEPPMQSVMQDGLEGGAEDAQKEQIKQMIGQALQGFKNNKQILEQSQAQSPELYSSCIAMLRAMIEMSKLLGISNGTEQLPNEQQGAQGQPGEPIPGQEEHPCPTCGSHPAKEAGQEPGKEKGGFPPKKDGKAPEKKEGKEGPPGKEKGGFPPKKEDKDKSAAPKEGAANEPPKESKPGGSGLGKLPTKATTKHTPRTPLTPGSINLKGQQKTIDQKTGKTRWIDRKKGVVMGPSGVPVKAAAQENN